MLSSKLSWYCDTIIKCNTMCHCVFPSTAHVYKRIAGTYLLPNSNSYTERWWPWFVSAPGTTITWSWSTAWTSHNWIRSPNLNRYHSTRFLTELMKDKTLDYTATDKPERCFPCCQPQHRKNYANHSAWRVDNSSVLLASCRKTPRVSSLRNCGEPSMLEMNTIRWSATLGRSRRFINRNSISGTCSIERNCW